MEKIARICYNDEGWLFPSGRKDKAVNKDSYEQKNGFGHEEWLLDFSKIIDGYHYGFLQPLSKRKKITCFILEAHLCGYR